MSILDELGSGIGGILGGVLGGVSGSRGTSSVVNNIASSVPWATQAPFLKTGFESAAANYAGNKNSPFFQGGLYAGLTPQQIAAITGSTNFATGQGHDLAQRFLGGAQGLLGQGDQFINSANRLAHFNPADPTQGNIHNAGLYANNPYMNKMVDAASRDVRRNLTEDVLPGINRSAVGGGNVDSSRTGIAEGIALRGAQDRIGDIGAQLRGNAYDQGLSHAIDERQTNQSARLNALASGAGFQDQAYGRGMDTTTQGIQQVLNNYDVMAHGGELQQGNQQGLLDEAFKKWQGGDSRAYDLLNRYMSTVGGDQWGKTTTSTTPGQSGSLMDIFKGSLTGAQAGLGLYKDLSGIFNGSTAQPQY